jgi:hypothetical protein
MGILSFNPSCNSLHSPFRSHHFRTSLASYTVQKTILLGGSLLWAYSNTQLHLSHHQHPKSRQPGSLHSLVCTNFGKLLARRLRDQVLTPPKIAPLFTNAFVYMVMGESKLPSIPQLNKVLKIGALLEDFWGLSSSLGSSTLHQLPY